MTKRTSYRSESEASPGRKRIQRLTTFEDAGRVDDSPGRALDDDSDHGLSRDDASSLLANGLESGLCLEENDGPEVGSFQHGADSFQHGASIPILIRQKREQ